MCQFVSSTLKEGKRDCTLLSSVVPRIIFVSKPSRNQNLFIMHIVVYYESIKRELKTKLIVYYEPLKRALKTKLLPLVYYESLKRELMFV